MGADGGGEDIRFPENGRTPFLAVWEEYVSVRNLGRSGRIETGGRGDLAANRSDRPGGGSIDVGRRNGPDGRFAFGVGVRRQQFACRDECV